MPSDNSPSTSRQTPIRRRRVTSNYPPRYRLPRNRNLHAILSRGDSPQVKVRVSFAKSWSTSPSAPLFLYHRSSWFRVKRSASLKRRIWRRSRFRGICRWCEWRRGFDRRPPPSSPWGPFFIGVEDEGSRRRFVKKCISLAGSSGIIAPESHGR